MTGKSTLPAVQIDPEFQGLIPPLTQEELAQLELNLVASGCRDALVAWRGILLDGHNRYSICTRLNIQFDVQEIELPDREAAKDWVDANQLGRRNLTPDAFKLLLGRRYNRLKRGHGGDRKSTEISSGQNAHLKTAETLAEKHGVDEKTVRRAGKFAEEVEKVPELKQAVTEGRPVLQVKRELKEARRQERRAENRGRVESTPDIQVAGAKFATIAIDPPWDFGDEGDVDQLGRGRPTYHQMPLDEIAALPIGDLADIDCHLYLWITNRSLPKGFALLERWGFRYITCLTWCKPSFGMGNYFRGSSEQVLFAVKGSQPLKRKDVGTWFTAPRGPDGHSSKPQEFYSLIESCSPGPYLDVFGRRPRTDWKIWGAEA